MAYVYEVDDIGHQFGPDSVQVNESIAKVDAVIGKLISRLKNANLFDKTNIIIVSDHGMTPLSHDRIINLDDYFNTSSVIIGDLSPISFLFPIDGLITKEQLYESLVNKHPNMSVYYKQDIPSKYQLYDNSSISSISDNRISPVVVIVDLGWQVITNTLHMTQMGDHGFDNQTPDMQAIFIAHGPNIKPRSNDTPTTFRNVELYNLLISLLDIEKEHVASNNGTSLLSDKIYLK